MKDLATRGFEGLYPIEIASEYRGGLFQRLTADKAYTDRVLGQQHQTAENFARMAGKIERGEKTYMP